MNCQREGCCDNIESLQIQQTIFEKNEAKKYADAIALCKDPKGARAFARAERMWSLEHSAESARFGPIRIAQKFMIRVRYTPNLSAM